MSGIASWYGPGFHGNRSASGEVYNQNAMTAAHRTLPFGTKVVVTNLNNGRSVVVRINDRGPFIRGRVIDLSAAAARALGVMQTGIAPVQVQVLGEQKTVASDSY
jgi:rare lipoprotein A